MTARCTYIKIIVLVRAFFSFCRNKYAKRSELTSSKVPSLRRVRLMSLALSRYQQTFVLAWTVGSPRVRTQGSSRSLTPDDPVTDGKTFYDDAGNR
jgi:hypothetical protein